MQDKISLAGDLGSGKSTVSDILLRRLGAEYYATGAIVRSIAARYGMGVGDFNVYMETHPEIDNEIDAELVKLGEVDKLLVIDSRMAWHFTPGTFKVYLSTDPSTSALRIMNAHRAGEALASLDEAVRATRARRESEKKRYLAQYGVDIKDLNNYSLVVDTTYATPDEIADVIISSLNEWRADKSLKRAYISSERLHYPADACIDERVQSIAAAIERGEECESVLVNERDGDFYIVSGAETALAYSLNMTTFVPVTLTDKHLDIEYVRMVDSL